MARLPPFIFNPDNDAWLAWKTAREIVFKRFNKIESLWNNELIPLTDRIFSWLGEIDNMVEGVLAPEISRVNDTSEWNYKQIQEYILPSLDVINYDLDVIWDDVYNLIWPELERIFNHHVGLEKTVEHWVIPTMLGIGGRVSDINIAIDDILDNILVSINNRLTVVENAVNTNIDFIIESLNIRLTAIENNINSIINPTLTELSLKLANIESNIQDVIYTTLNDMEIQMAKLATDIEMIERSVIGYMNYPLALLLSVLTDNNGVYSDYRGYWRQFALKILR